MICGFCKARGVSIDHVRGHATGAGLAAPVHFLGAPEFAAPVRGEGVYVKDGTYYKVTKSSRTGHFYAKTWDGSAWNYQPGAVNDLTVDMKATAEDAKRFGDLTGYCVFCYRRLTNTDPGCSVERGYGPVCAGREGLPWGRMDA